MDVGFIPFPITTQQTLQVKYDGYMVAWPLKDWTWIFKVKVDSDGKHGERYVGIVKRRDKPKEVLGNFWDCLIRDIECSVSAKLIVVEWK